MDCFVAALLAMTANATNFTAYSQEQHRRALAKGGRERLERRETGGFTEPAATDCQTVR